LSRGGGSRQYGKTSKKKILFNLSPVRKPRERAEEKKAMKKERNRGGWVWSIKGRKKKEVGSNKRGGKVDRGTWI